MLRRSLPLAATCVGLVLGTVVGCGQDDKPYAGSLPSKSSASPTPTKAHTKAPPKPTAQSAIATANRAVAAVNTLYATQDGRPLRAVSRVSCARCEAMFHAITTKKARGYEFSGGKITIRGRSSYRGLQKSTMTSSVVTPVSVASLKVTDPHGNPYVSSQDPAGGGPASPKAQISWLLFWDGTKWLVQGWDAEDVAS